MAEIQISPRERLLEDALARILRWPLPGGSRTVESYALPGWLVDIALDALGDETGVAFPRFLEDLGCWVHLDPELDCPGEVRYDGDQPTIYLREYDERVLLHECIHVVLFREEEARAALGDREERLVRWLTRRLHAMGWRLRQTDRTIAQLERELNEVAEQRDALAREIDGDDAPARDVYAEPSVGNPAPGNP